MRRFSWTLLVLALLLTACTSADSGIAIGADLGLDLSSGEVIHASDSHGGFHGDGTSYMVIAFSDDALLKQLESSSQWRALPMDDTATALVYGKTDGDQKTGPYFTDSEGTLLFPKIDEGYFLLIDRHSQAGKPEDPGIFQRGSFNLLLAIYDTETGKLHICEFDT